MIFDGTYNALRRERGSLSTGTSRARLEHCASARRASPPACDVAAIVFHVPAYTAGHHYLVDVPATELLTLP
jgi:citrate lyase synthetase